MYVPVGTYTSSLNVFALEKKTFCSFLIFVTFDPGFKEVISGHTLSTLKADKGCDFKSEGKVNMLFNIMFLHMP